MIQPQKAACPHHPAANPEGRAAIADSQIACDILEAGIAVTIFSLILGAAIWIVHPANQTLNLQPWLLPAMVLPAIPVSAVLAAIVLTVIKNVDARLSRQRAARTEATYNSRSP